MFAALGYDAMGMMAQAIGEAGTTDSAKIVDAMTNINTRALRAASPLMKTANPQRRYS